MTRRRRNDRAVSDLVGYVLTVSILLLGVGVVATVGVDQIERAQGTQNTQSAERGMELLQGNFDELQESRARIRTTTLSLSTGELGVNTSDEPTRVTVDVLGATNAPVKTYPMGTIAFRLEDSTLAYEGGGVFLNTTRGNAIARADPTFVCSGGRAIVSIVTLQGSALGTGFAGGAVNVIARENASRVLYPINRTGDDSIDDSTGVEVTIESEYLGAWQGYMLDSDQDWTQVGTGQYKCEDTSGMPVYVRQTVLNVSVRR